MTRVGDSWGEGYVTDIAYLPGYYPNQSPLHLHLACLLGGVAGIEISPLTPLSYLSSVAAMDLARSSSLHRTQPGG